MSANGADPHHDADKTVLKEGDSIVLDIGAPFNHYWCDMTRTVFYKSVSEEQREVYETVRKANEAAIALIKPGVAFKEFDLAARKVIEDAGYGEYFTHRTGHSIGMKEHEKPPVASDCEEGFDCGQIKNDNKKVSTSPRGDVETFLLLLIRKKFWNQADYLVPKIRSPQSPRPGTMYLSSLSFSSRAPQ